MFAKFCLNDLWHLNQLEGQYYVIMYVLPTIGFDQEIKQGSVADNIYFINMCQRPKI